MLIKSPKPLFFLGLAFSSVLFASQANAGCVTGTKADYGQAAPPTTAYYALKVDGATKWVNVNNGDTVRFDVNGKQFGWHFDTCKDYSIVKLSAIAPGDTDVGATRIYVSLNPVYMN